MPTRPVWLFDLDNTLHNASPHIFPHINRSMTRYLEQHLGLGLDEANALRMQYWHRYGATMLGLMRHHGTDPDHFLVETHRFDRLHEMMVFERALRGMLRALPGRRIVFSNAPRHYAEAVLEIMGVRRLFEDVVGIEDLDYHPKPGIRAYRSLLQRRRLNAAQCIMLEDSAVNLRTAKRLGMRTVLVGGGLRTPAYVDLRIPNILALRRQLGRLQVR
ncbi:MAG TPA: pyrimidine 5'-nucleotidase [Thauera sp.]|uniref:pyrimidine 5'-nucleotidase n=1 Tax=Thauera sp. TaxID=1905334 RepID=UPI000F9A9068|nr:pyrimidine 5'-nucleotidase [Thauera sp.]MCP5224203.1 pyrimidine 5'-nucleotidase [Thauera sp.]RTL27651.1 MAG: pyrimidine 5'-nucleotidase [Rhodocyclaceae bacterium]HRV77261.1 pyrimidine 5'-nucleotidase [Thauera sp.]